MPKNFYKAIAVLIGYIIGVGMFGLPFLISRSGILAFFILIIVIGLIQYFLHLIYINVILVTKKYHRLPGYAGAYLGEKGKSIAALSKLVGNYGALLAYIIITGIFLHQLLAPYLGGSEFIYATILFAIEALIIFFGIGMLASAELVMTILLLLVVIMISFRGWVHITPAHYEIINWKYLFLPYGAILFAVDGNGALPIVVKLLKRNQKYIRRVVEIGAFISILVIIIFTLVVIGVSGSSTTPDALTGLNGGFGSGMIKFALIFGLLTMVTSFLGVAESIMELFWLDYNVNKRLAWALAVFVPYFFYLAGVKSLPRVISIAGAIAGGTSAIILILIFRKLSKMKNGLIVFKRPPVRLITTILIFMFLCGILYELYYLIN